MQPTKSTEDYRSIIASVSPSMINNIDIRKPAVIAWWSASFPGFGHLILGNYFIGFILLIHEAVINALSGLNAAIYYSFVGEFEQAMLSIDTTWLLAYVPPYIFAIWNSYQRAKQLNEDYLIARQKGFEIYSNNVPLFGFNRMEEKKPYVAVFWSLLAPGLGHIYINRILVYLVVPLLVLIMYNSELLPAVHYTMTLDFESARNVANPQWLLNLPSIYGFMAYDAYVKTVEYNKLYKQYQQRYLEKTYQHHHFQMPI
ncbi:hypothetical protein KFZ58_17620 [Virgibacillus sp. NKC19-16]|uniref:hypothetical protein n=1 Tax=Virgibacillus salidurans TaxID=2831673 RepID=UPI001F351568|nr:hypothetical protein [Virgibacillus sp. NKC19-16]UJL46153.1 hypothetical protein KFZ58_17620 [Virgibacillus sp. NKC19-16]